MNINIDIKSDSELGRKLSMGYPFKFSTPVGNVYSVRRFIEFITKPGYPVELLTKKNLTARDINVIDRLQSDTSNIVNLRALKAYAYAVRLKADTELQNELKESVGTLESLICITKDILGVKTVTTKVNLNMSDSIIDIHHYKSLLQQDNFTSTEIVEYIKRLKINKEVSIFHGSHVNIESAI